MMNGSMPITDISSLCYFSTCGMRTEYASKNLSLTSDRHVENNTPPRWPRLVFKISVTSRKQTLLKNNSKRKRN